MIRWHGVGKGSLRLCSFGLGILKNTNLEPQMGNRLLPFKELSELLHEFAVLHEFGVMGHYLRVLE